MTVLEVLQWCKLASWCGAAKGYLALNTDERFQLMGLLDKWQRENLLAAVKIETYYAEKKG